VNSSQLTETPHRGSQLARMVPSLGSFFTPLKLVDAFLEYDEFFALSRRKYVPPNFAEMRHVLNIAQVRLSRCWPPAWTPLLYTKKAESAGTATPCLVLGCGQSTTKRAC